MRKKKLRKRKDERSMNKQEKWQQCFFFFPSPKTRDPVLLPHFLPPEQEAVLACVAR